MGQVKCKSENEKNLNNLYDEILRLSEQINSVKEKIEKEYPLVDSLSKIKKEIEEIKKKNNELEQYKSYAEGISKKIGELEKNDENEARIKWPIRFSIIVGLLFFVFSAICVWYLLFSTAYVKANDSIPMLIVGAIVYIIMAVMLVFFANQCRRNLK